MQVPNSLNNPICRPCSYIYAINKSAKNSENVTEPNKRAFWSNSSFSVLLRYRRSGKVLSTSRTALKQPCSLSLDHAADHPITIVRFVSESRNLFWDSQVSVYSIVRQIWFILLKLMFKTLTSLKNYGSSTAAFRITRSQYNPTPVIRDEFWSPLQIIYNSHVF